MFITIANEKKNTKLKRTISTTTNTYNICFVLADKANLSTIYLQLVQFSDGYWIRYLKPGFWKCHGENGFNALMLNLP